MSAALLEELQALLKNFEGHLDDPLLRNRVKALVPAFHALRELGSSMLHGDLRSGQARILAYFQHHVGVIIDGDELMVVSGIGEWARRVRELRVQMGWQIYSGTTIKEIAEDDADALADIAEKLGLDPLELRPDQYVLMSADQDRDAAHRWRTLNQLRKGPGSVKSKLLAYFKLNVGRKVSGEELRYLANDTREWTRRTRELRTEDGWAIATKQSGRRDLPIGYYVLEHDEQAQEHDRHIPDNVRVTVLKRDNYRCVECGWTWSMASPGDPRHTLELHHLVHHKDKGANEEDNLITVCNVHHDEIHKKGL